MRAPKRNVVTELNVIKCIMLEVMYACSVKKKWVWITIGLVQMK